MNEKNNLEIAVIGTGTAGITTLAHLLAWLPSGCKVTAIHDPDTAILGIGESTTTSIPESLYYGADFNFVNDHDKLDATIKNGVKYVNWREDDFYTIIPPPHYAMHFNNFKLREVCFEKFRKLWSNKFNIIEGKILDLKNSNDQAICNVSDQQLIFDYVIDCRGYPQDYSDYEIVDTIPVNHCIVHTVNEPGQWNYTYHMATPDGWMFGIPLQTRQGWGYLYNDKITTRDQAMKNQAHCLDISIDNLNVREFSFQNYRAKKFIDNRIIKNGNRALFYEPLEALSGWFYDRVIRAFFDVAVTERLNSEEANRMLSDVAEDYELFICYMYHGGSKHKTKFWDITSKRSRERLFSSDKFKHNVEFMKQILPEYYDNPSQVLPFPYKTWKTLDRDLKYNYFA